MPDEQAIEHVKDCIVSVWCILRSVTLERLSHSSLAMTAE
jgi:hypothetical protein